jgi:Protein of unknown function with PCYCGC motif
MRRSLLLPTLFLLASMLLAACGGESEDVTADLNMASMQDMPAGVQEAPLTVQQAYQFAVANPDIIQHIPCYCGCGAMGHTSNYSCYIAGENVDGSLIFDEHALGCSICVDITQDAMRLTREGKAVPEIRQYIDTTYAQYGPSNMP